MTREESDRIEKALRDALPKLKKTLRALKEARYVRPETMRLQFTI